MPRFSNLSQARLNECHADLQIVMNEAIKKYDFSVICGHRGRVEQDQAYNIGNSKLKYPYSKHNKFPSLAVDVCPYPIDWKDIDRFIDLSKVIKSVAERHKIKILWGGDWEKFRDYPHWELHYG